MSKYLKDKSEYIDRYDRATVERCRWIEKAISGTDIQKHHKKKLTKEEKARMSNAFNELHLWFAIGESYAKKEETILRWMGEDEERDRLLETAKAPLGITCHACKREMFVSHKHLETYSDAPDKVLFMYDCPSGHLPRRAFYHNGDEWVREAPLCPKCRTPLNQEDKDTKRFFKTISTCPKCGHVEVSEIERMADKRKDDPDYEKDRARFCSEEEGRKYVQWMSTAKELSAIIEKEKEKEKNKELYSRVGQLKKLTVPQAKEHISNALKETSYSNLVFEQPTMERIVSIGFTVEDSTDQGEYDSRTKLTKLLKKLLEETNWRLMSDGISYRLGILGGRIRVYEKEEDLVRLLSGKKDV